MTKVPSQQKLRHRARRLAMQALYQWSYNNEPVKELLETMLETQQPETKLDREYFNVLVIGAIKNHQRIDDALKPFLDRELSELNPVELAILRVSAFEMLDKIEIPYRVVINEGVELTKEFGADQGHKYVNAVLDKLAQQYRSIETNKQQ
ncbi:MAG: transcription antitermination factor NusB [Coxiellaceae bacterium]|nr:transcription antitermination factor NusB [Coxiellaceae bacterium]